MISPVIPRPATVGVLWPVAIVRTVLAAAVLVATLSVLPGTYDRSRRTLVNQRTGDVIEPLPQLKAIVLVAAVVGTVVGLVWVALWLYLARRAVQGVRWGVVGTAVLSGVGVLGFLSALALSAASGRLARLGVDYRLPGWVLSLSGAQAVVDLAVVVLLVLPASRRWFAATRAAPANGPPGPPPFAPGPRH